ncbi:MAG TPA: preprotein translocase subunit SecA, partial [Opitutales bacterium]|nr:preprotein translocase subunit SecA [Opitutales bacterium]
MISWFFRLFKGQHYRKFLKKVNPLVQKINLLEEEYQQLSEDALRAKTAEFKERYQNGETLEQLLPEAFAVVKNAARRMVGQKIVVCDHELTWDMVPFDVQLIGGMSLHWGRIAEMATGEGKTLVATLPLYLNALSGRNCQLVTVNDYLVRRDAEWNGYLYRYLGLTVGYIQNQMESAERRAAYAADITYGTASEFGFDYLRDNGMATRQQDQVQRDHFFCIVDEVDSILVDEARTPLIISGPVQVEREAPFPVFKPAIERLVSLQNRLCTRLATEAKEVLDASVDGDAAEEAIKKLLQVRMGMPKNRVLMRLMEQGPVRKKLDRLEVEMNGDFRRDELYHLKEELYFTIEEKHHQSDLTELGRQTLSPNDPDGFMLPDLSTLFMELDRRLDLSADERQRLKLQGEDRFQQVAENIHCIGQLLRAYCLYERDVEYVVQDGKVVIVDENTGRIMPGRRWSDGLHQAVEAKEGTAIQEESKTYATITIQNYFRLYDKLAGMTGTAETEATEFNDIYKLEVVAIPSHRPCIRKDLNDVIYKTRREKYNAALRDIKEAHDRGQPVLVGTTSVESSEVLSKMLKRENIKHSVLNAKFHAQEAEIVSLAGQKGAVTIATNMAGRGTDIKIGEGVAALGGLFVLGTERHESRRIDRQLRGRCARQGDPGASKFFISLEDNLMRLFANAGPISRILENSFEEGEELAHPLLNRSIESAQKKVEEHNYAIRKRLLKYDDVLNQQREVIYGIRNDALRSESPKDILFEMVEEELGVRIDGLHGRRREKADLEGFLSWLNMTFPVGVQLGEIESLDEEQMLPWLLDKVRIAYNQKESLEDPELFKQIERYTIIRPIDRHWQDHLTEMEELRRSVGLRSYGQKDPLNEYKSEAFTYFEQMMGLVRADICVGLFRAASSFDNFQKMLQALTAQQARAEETGPTTPVPTAPQKGSTKSSQQTELPKIEP